MPKRIYVGNLPFDVSERDLRNELAEHGKIEGIDIKTDKTNRNAMAIIVFEGDGPNAIVGALNGRAIGGRKVVASDDRKVVINHEEQYS